MTEKIIEIRTRMVEPVCVPDYSDYERRLQYIELQERIDRLDYNIELRYNHNHDEKGRFCSGGGGGRMSSSSEKRLYSNGGVNPEKNVDKSEKSDIIESKQPSYNFDPKVKPDVKEAFNEEYSRATAKYGKITTISGVDVLNDRSTDEGTYNDNSRRIALRYADKKNGLKTMESVAQEKYKDGKWSTGNQRHAMRHEIGHAIQLEHQLNDPQWNDKLSKINEIAKKASKKEDGHLLPSKYSGKELEEFISECIAASYSKKQSKTVKEVAKIIIGE